MAPILQHLVEMTGHRDHLRLEASVLTTVLQLGKNMEVRALEFFFSDSQVMVRPRSWTHRGEVISSECEAPSDPARGVLANMPELTECLREHCVAALRSSNNTHTLWLPVWIEDKAYACLEITQPRAFSRRQRDIIMGVFQVYQNYQNLLDYSERDALTGLFNRKTFEEHFARITSQPITGFDQLDTGADVPQQWLAVIDIDHFKQVNDVYGHLYGDEVLILVANLLRSSFRAQDRVFRFGGEEFVVLLRSATLEQASQAFERFRQTVEKHMFPQIGGITVSIGFTSTMDGAPVEVLGRADQALYYAKENGRNQVRYYDLMLSRGEVKPQISHGEIELF
ncbi:GGDEF domain-containing protein [Diaphorobacter aerolatus]|uniref:diguanylate cyclase n=1 Tax=Diaphorobacter aerolatus TaxID=1288495 RepID=A0A7H0GL45_9BURK|nr:GGDEF domain-containing protein [Diaphorobacter aerolatus]QNP49011.1 GGDEF domain-containing protein [Diaphorobacter aerolatus]